MKKIVIILMLCLPILYYIGEHPSITRSITRGVIDDIETSNEIAALGLTGERASVYKSYVNSFKKNLVKINGIIKEFGIDRKSEKDMEKLFFNIFSYNIQNIEYKDIKLVCSLMNKTVDFPLSLSDKATYQEKLSYVQFLTKITDVSNFTHEMYETSRYQKNDIVSAAKSLYDLINKNLENYPIYTRKEVTNTLSSLSKIKEDNDVARLAKKGMVKSMYQMKEKDIKIALCFLLSKTFTVLMYRPH